MNIVQGDDRQLDQRGLRSLRRAARKPARRGAASTAENNAAVERKRVTAKRMVGLPGDTPLRTDESGYPVNRMFADVPQDAARDRNRAGLRERSWRLQPVRLSVALRRDVESVCLLRRQGQPVLPDLGGVHPAGRSRQRPLRVVRRHDRRDRLGRQGQGRPARTALA